MIYKEKDYFILENFPMPPTVNKSYGSSIRKGRIIRYDSQEMKSFKNEVLCFKLLNKRALNDLVNYFIPLISEKNVTIRLDRIFYFDYKRLYNLKGGVKQLDLTNRIKALDDAIESITGINDKYIFEGTEHKSCTQEGNKECVSIKISSTKTKAIKSFMDI